MRKGPRLSIMPVHHRWNTVNFPLSYSQSAYIQSFELNGTSTTNITRFQISELLHTSPVFSSNAASVSTENDTKETDDNKNNITCHPKQKLAKLAEQWKSRFKWCLFYIHICLQSSLCLHFIVQSDYWAKDDKSKHLNDRIVHNQHWLLLGDRKQIPVSSVKVRQLDSFLYPSCHTDFIPKAFKNVTLLPAFLLSLYMALSSPF